MSYADPAKQREAQAGYMRRKKNGVKAFLRQYKESKPCTDCGISYPYYVMQLDHVRGEKDKDVSVLKASGHMAAVLRELPKCDLVCANCHAVRTWRRLQDVSQQQTTPLGTERQLGQHQPS